MRKQIKLATHCAATALAVKSGAV